jgi:predicted amidohydrolase YtcJ
MVSGSPNDDAPAAPSLNTEAAPGVAVGMTRPGFAIREAHAHLPALGEWLITPRMDAVASLDECLARVRQEVLTQKAGGGGGTGVFARFIGARVQAWSEARWPTPEELDFASGGLPVVIMSFDHHSAVCNASALALAGLTVGQKVGDRGLVEAHEKHGAFTGLLLEDAAYAVWRCTPADRPAPGEVQKREMIRAAASKLAGLGFVEVHDLHSPAWLGSTLAELQRAGELPIKVGLYAAMAEIEQVIATRGSFESAQVRLLGAKVFSDGTLNSRTALMIHRYAEPIAGFPRGQCMIAPLHMDAAIRRAEELGIQLAVHAIGDGAVRTVLDCVARVKPARNRVRLEHAEVVDKSDVGRFAELGVTCSVQPCHLLADVEALNRFVPHRLDRVLPLRELLDSGLKPGLIPAPGESDCGLVFGSDVPIVRAEPEDSIRAATQRRREEMSVFESIAPKQAISETEAWSCFAAG